MNTHAVQLLFLKDLFLSRWYMFGYLVGGLASVAITCLPLQSAGFIGFILMVTVSIASGMHLIGQLLLAESTDQTRTFIMSLPVSLLDYAISKISVVLTTFLIPWTGMLACLIVCMFVVPGAKPGMVACLTIIFLFLFSTFTLQLVTAVVTESVGWTICVLVLSNILLNLFLKVIFENSDISTLSKSDSLYWPPIVLQILAGEVAFILTAIGISLWLQTRKRDLV